MTNANANGKGHATKRPLDLAREKTVQSLLDRLEKQIGKCEWARAVLQSIRFGFSDLEKITTHVELAADELTGLCDAMTHLRMARVKADSDAALIN